MKVYKNRDKLNKIYPLVYKYANARLNSPPSMHKTLILLFNFLRKGPKEVTGNYTSTMRDIVDMIGKKYPEGPASSDSLVLELLKLLTIKYELTQKYSEIYDGNFHLPKLACIQKIDFPTLESLLSYLSYLISLLERIQSYTFRSLQLCHFIFSNLCDEVYDLTVTLVMLYVSINKDV